VPVTPLSTFAHGRPAEMLIVLGLISGSLSATFGLTYDLEVLQPLAVVFLLASGALPIGFFYGVALGIGMAAWTRKPWAGLVVLITTIYAWSAAVHTAIRLQRNSGDDAFLFAASLCAGALGAGLAHLGCSLFAAELRHPWRIASSCAVGAAGGMLFYLAERSMIDERLLYLVWQPAVAFTIGLGLPRAEAKVAKS
jgi:fumarate reductase subunit D